MRPPGPSTSSAPARTTEIEAGTAKQNRPLTSLGQVSAIGAELKSCAKTLGGSRSSSTAAKTEPPAAKNRLRHLKSRNRDAWRQAKRDCAHSKNRRASFSASRPSASVTSRSS